MHVLEILTIDLTIYTNGKYFQIFLHEIIPNYDLNFEIWVHKKKRYIRTFITCTLNFRCKIASTCIILQPLLQLKKTTCVIFEQPFKTPHRGEYE